VSTLGIQTYKVKLPENEKKQLEQIVHSGTAQARTITRAQVLLNANEGKKDEDIYQPLHLAVTTPYDIRKRYCEEGLHRALYDLPRPGQPRKLTGVQEARVVAIACTKAPKGADHWTMDLLTEEAQKQLGVTIRRSAIWHVCLRNQEKPWLKKNVGHSKTYPRIYPRA
jgi:putative transposase